MKITLIGLLFLMLFGCTWREAIGTCVLETDFGFTFNCAFKKSGLFRVRNLGGVKGYVGLGFTVGDELGFPESLGNVEQDKRRSVQVRKGLVLPNMVQTRNGLRQPSQTSSRVVPPFKPLPVGGSRPLAQQPERQTLVVMSTNATAFKSIPAPSLMMLQNDKEMHQRQAMLIQQEMDNRQQQTMQQEAIHMIKQQKFQEEALALQMLKQQRMQQQEAMRQQQLQKYNQQQILQSAATQNKRSQAPNGIVAFAIDPQKQEEPQQETKIIGVLAPANSLPPFISMPKSSSHMANRISHNPVLIEETSNEVHKDDFQLPLPEDDAASAVNEMTLLSFQPAVKINNELFRLQDEASVEKRPVALPSTKPVQEMEPSLKNLAQASNISLEALEAAILLRQQQVMDKHKVASAELSTTTSTVAPVKSKPNFTATKVMNAPREYYPVGYDKNFDDNFASRVDLPDTTFYCGDQKHFPGLYADEDLGCMVFHVCALTDDGLIMKSFLCPESTLFDQTILKCNWWFYVDCKSSKGLYDSNIPISKSYQLMKALAFFSAYKNNDNSTASEPTKTEKL